MTAGKKKAADLDKQSSLLPELGKMTSKASVKSKVSEAQIDEGNADMNDGWGDADDGGDEWGADDYGDDDAWANDAAVSDMKKVESAVAKGPYRVLTLKDIED